MKRFKRSSRVPSNFQAATSFSVTTTKHDHNCTRKRSYLSGFPTPLLGQPIRLAKVHEEKGRQGLACPIMDKTNIAYSFVLVKRV